VSLKVIFVVTNDKARRTHPLHMQSFLFNSMTFLECVIFWKFLKCAKYVFVFSFCGLKI